MAAKRPANRIEALPNGLVVAFWDSIGVDGESQQRRYRVGGEGGEKYPSVSTIAGIYKIPALLPKAVKMQEEAVIALAQSGVDLASLTQPQLRAKLWEAGTHYDAIWGQARARGDVAHDMLLALLRDRIVPDLRDYDADLHPWLSAGMKFAHDERPEVIDTEYMVASTTHKFAGRGDLLCVPQRGPRKNRIIRYDYKTLTAWSYKKDRDGNVITDDSGEPVKLPPYDENLIALAGYELGAVESGRLPSDARCTVRLGPDGEYDVTESHADETVFEAALTAHREKKYLTTGRPELVPA